MTIESTENLLVEQEGKVLTVTVNRPKVLNALNRATLEQMDHVFGAAACDESVGGVLLTGSGDKAFVAGADIKELSVLTPFAAKEVAGYGQRVFSKIERLGKPVVGAINGFALGGGLELACACSFRVASSKAMVGLPETKLGVIPGYGGTQRLARLVGLGRATELVLTGEPIDANEAFRLGLVNHVYEPDELIDQARGLLQKILKRGPVAVKCALEALFRGPDLPLDEGLNLECNLFGLVTTTEDMKEGMAAFLEKRKADFKGR